MHGYLAVILLCAICIVGFGMCTGELIGLKGLNSYIDLNQSECKDFYGYVCKNVKDSGLQRRNRATITAVEEARFHSICYESKSPFSSYYKSCLDLSSSERFLISKFNQIDAIIYKEKKNFTEHDLAKLLDETSTLNNSFFEYGRDNADKNTFVIGGRTSLESTELSDTNEEYKTFINQVFKELDPLYDEDEWGNVLKLEGEIINVVNNNKDRSYFFNNGKQFYIENKKRENFTISQLKEELKKSEGVLKFDLSRFLEYFDNRIRSGIQYSKVIFMGLNYFKDLQKTLGGYNSSIISKYILLRATLSLYTALPKRFQDISPPKEFHWRFSRLSCRKYDETYCMRKTEKNLKYLEEQFYMDERFSGQAKHMADKLYKSIKGNLKILIKDDPAIDNNIETELLKKMEDMKVHLGRFELPYFQYKKTSFYNGSYFENLLASKRDFSLTIAAAEDGIDLENLKKFRESGKISYYNDNFNTLYIFSYVFNPSSQRNFEFFGAAGPHIVEALLDAIKIENFWNCSRLKQKENVVCTDKENLKEFLLKTKLDLTLKAYQEIELAENESDTEYQGNIQNFFIAFVQEFCGATNEDKGRLNEILSSDNTFQTTFHCYK